MNTVQPIRDKETIEDMKNELLKRGYRDYMLFVVGINTGLRIGDILKLKVKDVQDRTHIHLRGDNAEQKTGKTNRIKMNDSLIEEIDRYTKGMDPNDYLFESQRSDEDGSRRPISRVQAYRVLNAAAKEIGLDEVGTHTLRKTFGYWYYKQYNDIAYLMKLLNHSSPSVTLDYIGMSQETIDATMDDFYL